MAKMVASVGIGAIGVRLSRGAAFRKALFASTALVGTRSQGARRTAALRQPAIALVSMIAAAPIGAALSVFALTVGAMPSTASAQTTSQATRGGNGGRTDTELTGGTGGQSGVAGGDGSGALDGNHDGAGGGGGGVGAAGGRGGAGGSSGGYANGAAGGLGGATGAAGGNGADGLENFSTYGPGGGGGGGGGAGQVVSGTTVTVAANVVGGAGGTGGRSTNGGGGGGGAGGYGIQSTGAASVTILTGVVLQGGAGGNGGTAGAYGQGGQGGGGGGGVFGSGSLINNGVIQAGASGTSAANGVNAPNYGLPATAPAPVPSAAVIGTGLAVTNTGTIGATGQTANSIAFISGANSLTLGAGGVQGTLNGDIGVTGSLAIDPGTGAGVNATLANVIKNDSTAGSVAKVGAGTLTFSAVNTYTGATTISAGTLALSGAGSIAQSASVTNNATFDIAGVSGARTVNQLMGTGNVLLGANTLTTINNVDGTISGVISGSGGFVKTGTGTLTLTAQNDYTGGTTVAGGTLRLQDALTPNGTAQINAGTTLELNYTDGSRIQRNATFQGAGTLLKTGAGEYRNESLIALSALGLIDIQGGRFTGSNAESGRFTGNQGSLNIGASGFFDGVEGDIFVNRLTGTGRLGGGFQGRGSTTIGVANGTATFDGTITDGQEGSLALIKAGAGTQTLTGVNTYTGGTTISGGVLAGTTAGFGTGAIVDNARLAIVQANSGTLTNAVSGTGFITVSGVGVGNTVTFGGALSNAGGLQVLDGSSVRINAGAAGGIFELGAGSRTLTIAGGAATNATGSTNGSGLFIDTISGTTTVDVLSGATLSTTAGAGNRDGITALDNTVVTNAGTIASSFNAGIALAGGGSIANTGTITGGNGGNGYGIAVSNNFAAALTLDAGGVVSGTQGGVLFASTGAGATAATLSNAGQITSGRYGIEATAVGTPVLINRAGGQIVGGTDGIRSAGSVDITNSGLIGSGTLTNGTYAVGGTATGSSGVVLTGTTGGIVRNLLGGTIQGLFTGVYGQGTGALRVENAGLIAGTDGGNGVVVFNTAAAPATVINTGTITSTGATAGSEAWGIALYNGGTITNTGGVSGDQAIELQSAGNVIVINGATGSLSGLTNSIRRSGTGVLDFTNYGAAAGALAHTSSGIATIALQAGSTTGAVTTGAANDTLALYNGAVTTMADVDVATGLVLRAAGTYGAATVGAVDLGGGADTLVLRGIGDGAAAGAAGSFGLDTLTGAESLLKLDTGTWTLTGAAATPAITINAGDGGNDDGLLIFDGTTGLTGAINVNGTIIRANTAGAFGTGTITFIDPTAQYAATGTYANAIVLASADPVGDPTILQTFGTDITAMLTGQISQPGGAAQPLRFRSTDTAGVQNTGTFELTDGDNDYAGLTTVETGVTIIQRNVGTALGSGGVAIATGATVQIDNQTGGALGLDDGTYTGAGTLAFTGNAGSVTNVGFFGTTTAIGLSSAGLIDVRSGELVGSSNNQGSWTDNLADLAVAAGAVFTTSEAQVRVDTLTGAGTVRIDGSGSVTLGVADGTGTFDGTIVDQLSPGGLTKEGVGTQTLTGINTYSGATMINAGTLALSGAGSIANSTILIGRGTANAFGGTLDISGVSSGGTTIAYLVSDTNSGVVNGSAIVLGANTLTLSPARLGNTFDGVISGTGGLTLGNDSTLFLGGANTFTGTTRVNTGATLLFDASDVLADTSTLTIDGGGTLDLQGYTDTVTTLNLTGTLLGGGTLSAANFNTFAGSFIGQGLGTGTLNVFGDTVLAGQTTASPVNIVAGTLTLGDPNAIADPNALASDFANRLSPTATVAIAGGAGLTLGGTETIGSLSDLNGAGGTIDLAGSVLTIGTDNSSTVFSGAIGNTGPRTANTADTNGLTKVGTGTLTLAGTNSFEGLTAIVEGTLALLGGSAIADGGTVDVATAGAFAVQASETIGSLTGTGAVDLGQGATLTIGTASDFTFGGAIAGAGGLTKIGAGVFTLAGASSYAGATDVAQGTLRLGASDVLSDLSELTVRAGAVLDLNSFSDTVAAFTLENGGTLTGGGVLTAAGVFLDGGTLGMGIAANTVIQRSNTTLIDGTIDTANLLVRGGELRLGAGDRIADRATVTVDAGTAFNLQEFDDTVGALVLNGTLSGTGTLTAATYTLGGGTANANLGAGTLDQVSGNSTLNGTAAAATVNVIGGTLTLGAAERLSDTAALTIGSGGVLDLGAFQETVGTVGIAGSLNGTGTLTAATYALNGAVVNANLGAGTLTQAGGTSTLNGTAAAATVDVTGGTLVLGASARLADTATLTIGTGGVLDLGAFNETVGTVGIAGSLNGTGTLTAATYTLNSGTVNGNLGTGTLTQAGGTSTLNGASAAAAVNVTGGTLVLGAAERLADTAALTVGSGGVLDLGAFNETVGTAGIAGSLNGTGTLTATTYALNSGTVNANLGTGTLTQAGGTSTLNGASAAAAVNVTGGTLVLGAAERLANTAALTIGTGGVLDLGAFQETVGTAGIAGSLNGTGTLTAASYALNGGTVNANLGTGTLTQAGGTSTLNGTAGAAAVNVAGGTLRLGAAERLANTAALTIGTGGVLDLGAFTETVGTAGIAGTLNGTGTLTASTYALNGGIVNANLGAGTLTQAGGSSTLNGIAAAATVNVNGGTLNLGASNRLLDTATVTVGSGATFNLGANTETVGALVLGGTLAGGGTLTAATYTLSGGTANANLGAGTLVQASGTSTLAGTSAAVTVNVNAGTLRLGAADRLADGAAVTVAGGATLNVAGFAETVGSLAGNGTVALGAGSLTFGGLGTNTSFGGAATGTGDLVKTGTGTLTLAGNAATTARLVVNAGTLAFSGSNGGAVRVAGGTLTGSGTIAANLALASGTLSPGNASTAIGALQANSLTVTGGTYLADFAANGGSDTIRVTGAATLSGGIVVPRSIDPAASYQVSQTYTLLSAGALTGTFANGAGFTPTGNNPQIAYRLRYDLVPNAVLLEIRRQIDFGLGISGATRNQLAVSGALNGAAFSASDDWARTLNSLAALAPAQRQAAFDLIGGEAATGTVTAVALAGDRFTDLIRTRLSSGINADRSDTGLAALGGDRSEALRRASKLADNSSTLAGDADGDRVGVWLQGYGADGTIEGGRGLATVQTFAAGVAGGLELRTGAVTIGAAGSVSDLETKLRARQSRSTGTLYQGGGYVAYDDGRFFTNAVGSYFKGDVATGRQVYVGPTLAGRARGETEAEGYTLGGSFGTRLGEATGIRLSPQLSGQMVSVKRDAYTETGAGGLSLSVGRQERKLYTATGEVRLSHVTQTETGSVEPWASIGVQRSFGDRDTFAAMRFTGAPIGTGAFTIQGATLPKLAGLLGGGIDAHPTDRVTLGTSVESTISNRQKEARISMHLRLGF